MKLAIGLGASWDNTATNESGFSALPAGNRGNNGVFGNLSLMASFWNSGEYATWGGIRTYLAGTTSVYSVPFNKPMGASVRCIKD